MIDHTLLKADATKAGITTLIEEAKEYGFASVCVNPTWVSYAAEKLQGTEVLVCTVIGFPTWRNDIGCESIRNKRCHCKRSRRN